MQITNLAVFLVLGQAFANPWDPVARGDGYWTQKHKQLIDLTLQHGKDVQIVFLGYSITDFWVSTGKDVWKKNYANRHAYDYGISGDRTENVIYRLKNKEFDGLKPKVTVLMIGTNNLGSNTVEDIAKGVQEVLHQISVKMPQSKVILLAVTPRPGSLGSKAKELNKLIAKMVDEKTVFYLDMWLSFESPNRKQKTELFVDNLHLNAAGYAVWQKTMEPLLQKLLA